MKIASGMMSVGLAILLLGCATASSQKETTSQEAQAAPSAETDAVTAASEPFFDKPDDWNKDNLLALLRDHLG